MKNLVLAASWFTLISLQVGCGKAGTAQGTTSQPLTHGPCYSVFNGVWLGEHNTYGNNYLTLNDQCSGTTSVCNEQFTYQPQADGITAIVIVTKTNGGPLCLPLGPSTLTVQMLPNQNNNIMQVSGTDVSGRVDSDAYTRISGP